MNLKHGLIVVAIIVVLGIFFGGSFSKKQSPEETEQRPGATHPAAPTTAPQTSSAANADPTTPVEGESGEEKPSATAVPTYDGHDEHGPVQDPEMAGAALATADQFIAGWLNPDPRGRVAQLQGVAGEALIEQLAVPNLRIWSTKPDRAPTVVQLLDTTVMVRQTFADGRAVDLLLLADPRALHGWIVSDVQPA